MKVYGGMFFHKGRQVRGIIAGTQKQAADATKSGLSYIRDYWSRTGNEQEIRIATSAPGQLFYETRKYSYNFKKVTE